MLKQTPLEESIRIFAHLLGAERVWANRLAVRPASCPVRPDWNLSECETALADNVEDYRMIIKSLPQTGEITYTNTKGETFTSTTVDILFHVLMHGAYHRGQISQAIQAAGSDIIDTDYILFRR